MECSGHDGSLVRDVSPHASLAYRPSSASRTELNPQGSPVSAQVRRRSSKVSPRRPNGKGADAGRPRASKVSGLPPLQASGRR